MRRKGRTAGGAGLAFGLALAALAGLAPASAWSAHCRLALALGLDVSASVDMREYTLMNAGTAAALTSPQVREAILAHGGVYLAIFEWSGQRQQELVVDWVALEDDDAIFDAARRLSRSKRSFAEFPTALGSALGYASSLLRRAPGPCFRRVVDMAGDGPNNHGFPPASAYRAFDFADVTVNGLVVTGPEPEAGADALAYYQTEVIHGPGAFIEVAAGYAGFQRAMQRKLLREITPAGLASLSRQ